jgi:hypothetical protein
MNEQTLKEIERIARQSAVDYVSSHDILKMVAYIRELEGEIDDLKDEVAYLYDSE